MDTVRLNQKWDKKEFVNEYELAAMSLEELMAIANEYEPQSLGRRKLLDKKNPYQKSWRTLQRENQAKISAKYK